MGLLDSVLGAMLNNRQQPQAGETAQAGGMGSIMSMLAGNPQLIQIALGMLGNNGTQSGLGGLSGLVSKFEQAGMSGVMNSWIGEGPNEHVSGAQINDALGSGTIANIATQLGVNPVEAADQLSAMLPGIINHLTPDGTLPAEGQGQSSNLMGMLSGMIGR